MTYHTQPREAAPVYRCCDSHWHFIPHKYDHLPGHIPWYRQLEYPDKAKWEPGKQPIYVQGGGDKPYVVDRKHVSGFYTLIYGGRRVGGWDQEEWCTGRYGKKERKLWREEELSDTPWRVRGRSDAKGPPSYQEQQ